MLNKANEGCTESEENLSHKGGFTPFPYRVAKALDEDIFRNTDFDIWHEIRRGMKIFFPKIFNFFLPFSLNF